jgi:hypothetical protein
LIGQRLLIVSLLKRTMKKERQMPTELTTKLRALGKAIEETLPDLSKLDTLKEDVKVEEAALAGLRERRVAEEAEFNKQEAAHKRELEGMEKAKAKVASDLTAMQDRVKAAEGLAKTREAEARALLVQHDQILKSIESMRTYVRQAVA